MYIIECLYMFFLVYNDYCQVSVVFLLYEIYSVEDVLVYVMGFMVYLFDGVYEQYYIVYVLVYVVCVGINKQYCNGFS